MFEYFKQLENNPNDISFRKWSMLIISIWINKAPLNIYDEHFLR